MIKYIKRLLIILAFVFSANTMSAQNSILLNYGNYNEWVLSNNTCNGCSSFFAMVVNNPTPSNGYYYYDIYLWGNSFYSNGYAANTYIKSVNVYMLTPSGTWNSVIPYSYLIVPPKSDVFDGYFYVGYIYSTSKMQSIKITWVNTSVW